MKQIGYRILQFLMIVSLTLQLMPLYAIAETLDSSLEPTSERAQKNQIVNTELVGEALATYLATLTIAEQQLMLTTLTAEQQESLVLINETQHTEVEVPTSQSIQPTSEESSEIPTSDSEAEEEISQTTSSVNEEESEVEGISAMSVLTPGPLLSSLQAASESNLVLEKKATYNPATHQVDFQLEAYAKGSIVTEMRPTDIVLVLDVSGSMGLSFDSTTRIGALRAAVNSFADTLFLEASQPGNNQYHTIKVVTYSSSASVVGTTYQTNRAGDRQKLSTLLTNLKADGLTRQDLGLDKAVGLIQGNRPSAKQAVILFTDGKPEGNIAEGRIAAQAVNSAYNIKNTLGTTIYTVGIQASANPYSILSSDVPNSMMNGISSNYPQAFVSNVFNYKDTLKLGTRGSSDNYYLTTNNASELTSIFQRIATEIGKIENVDIRDILSEELFLPITDNAQADLSSLKVYKAWEYQPSLREETGIDVDYAQTSKALTIRKLTLEPVIFDSNQQPTAATKNNKLIIRFSSNISPNFMGGNQVVTNKQESGAYAVNQDGSETFIQGFIQPKVNIPLKNGSIEIKDQKTYIGNSTTVREFFKNINNLDGLNNRYATVSYTIKKNQEVVAVGEIPAGTAFQETAFLASATESADVEYEATYHIRAALPPLAGTQGVEPLNTTGAAKIYIFYPELKAQDRKIYLTNKLDSTQKLPEILRWRHSQETSLTELSFVGEQPEISAVTYELPEKLTHTVEQGQVVAVQLSNQKKLTAQMLEPFASQLAFSLFVFSPKITSTNQKIDLGGQTSLAERSQPAVWQNEQTTLTGIEGLAPILELTPLEENGSVSPNLVKLMTDTSFSWSVVANEQTITEYVLFENNDYDQASQPAGAHFTIYVVGASLKINKQLVVMSQLRNFGTESFLFEIIWTDSEGLSSETYYDTITLDKNQVSGSVQLSQLKPGTYQIKELIDWSSRYVTTQPEITITLTRERQEEVTFVNTLTNTKWLSHEVKVDNQFIATSSQ